MKKLQNNILPIRNFVNSQSAILSIFLLCCTPSLMPPVETDVSVAKQRWSNASITQLNEGYSLYKNKCGNCHYLYRPDKFSEEKWLHDIPAMAIKSKLDSSQINLITRYILTVRATRSFVKP